MISKEQKETEVALRLGACKHSLLFQMENRVCKTEWKGQLNI